REAKRAPCRALLQQQIENDEGLAVKQQICAEAIYLGQRARSDPVDKTIPFLPGDVPFCVWDNRGPGTFRKLSPRLGPTESSAILAPKRISRQNGNTGNAAQKFPSAQHKTDLSSHRGSNADSELVSISDPLAKPDYPRRNRALTIRSTCRNLVSRQFAGIRAHLLPQRQFD